MNSSARSSARGLVAAGVAAVAAVGLSGSTWFGATMASKGTPPSAAPTSKPGVPSEPTFYDRPEPTAVATDPRPASTPSRTPEATVPVLITFSGWDGDAKAVQVGGNVTGVHRVRRHVHGHAHEGRPDAERERPGAARRDDHRLHRAHGARRHRRRLAGRADLSLRRAHRHLGPGGGRRPVNRLRQLLRAGAVAVVAAAAVVVPAVSGLPGSTAEAANLSLFDPGNIISDAVFLDSTSMDAGTVQNFLNLKGANCVAGAMPCVKNYTQTTATQAGDAYCSTYRARRTRPRRRSSPRSGWPAGSTRGCCWCSSRRRRA